MTAPRTEAERAAWVDRAVRDYKAGRTSMYRDTPEDPIAYAERVVPPVAPSRVAPPSVTLSDGTVVEYRKGAWAPWVRRSTNGDDFASDRLASLPLTDDDLAACLALRDAPAVDPVEEFRALVTRALGDTYNGGTGRGMTWWVGTDAWRDRIMDAALALFDAHAAPATMGEAECVAGLVAHGWKDYTEEPTRSATGTITGRMVARRVLIAPAPERAP